MKSKRLNLDWAQALSLGSFNKEHPRDIIEWSKSNSHTETGSLKDKWIKQVSIRKLYSVHFSFNRLVQYFRRIRRLDIKGFLKK